MHGSDEWHGIAQIAAEIPHQIEVEEVPKAAVLGGLPFVPAHFLEASVHARGLELDDSVDPVGIQGQDVEAGGLTRDALSFELCEGLSKSGGKLARCVQRL